MRTADAAMQDIEKALLLIGSGGREERKQLESMIDRISALKSRINNM